MNWQPIETAPTDGSEVWAFNGEQARMKFVSAEWYALWIWANEVIAAAEPHPIQPTHWMPLPAPPGGRMNADTKTKLQELLRGERDWDKLDMARECLDALERTYFKGYRDGLTDTRSMT